MKRRSLLLLCLLMAFGCKKNQDPTPQNTVPDGLKISLFEVPVTTLWAFVTDQDGNIIASAPNDGGDILLLSTAGTTVPDTVSLTIFQKVNGSYDFLSSFAGIFRVSNWHLPETIDILYPPSGDTGGYQLKITDIVHSDITSAFYTSDKYTVDPFQFTSTEEFVSVYPRPGADSLLLSGYRGNTPVYKWITDNLTIPTATQVALSLNDFTDARSISITYDHKPGLFFSGWINVVNAPNLSSYAYTTCAIPYYQGDANPVMGYQYGIFPYRTHVSYGDGKKSTAYDRTFTINNNISLPALVDFTPSDTSMAHFEYSFPHDYSYNHMVWFRDGGGFTWGLFSAAHTPLPRVNSLPDDLSTAHPELALDVAHSYYNSSSFVRYAGGETYAKTLNDHLSQHFDAGMETFTFFYGK